MITAYLFYLIWNSQIHKDNPTLIPVLLTIFIILYLLRIGKVIKEIIKD
jgi:hypothetical protein